MMELVIDSSVVYYYGSSKIWIIEIDEYGYDSIFKRNISGGAYIGIPYHRILVRNI